MEDFVFHEGDIPSDYKLKAQFSVFHEHRHRVLQAVDGWHTFAILNKKHKTAEAVVYFHLRDGEASSPLRASYGSYALGKDVMPLTIFQFIEFVDARLKAEGATTITIKEPPALYNADRAALMHTFLINAGYSITDAEVGSVVNIDYLPFVDKISANESARLHKAREAGLTFRPVDLSHLTDFYLFIFGCQKERGYQLSMTLPQLSATVEACRDRYFGFGVYDGEDLVAASLAILVQPGVIYNFYCTHRLDHNHLSPVIMLLDGLYNFGRNHHARILDLGTSAIDHRPNFGLLDFKLRLGGKPTPKFTFVKNL